MKVDEMVFEKIAMFSSFLEYDDCVRILSLASSLLFIPPIERPREVSGSMESDLGFLCENFGSCRWFD